MSTAPRMEHTAARVDRSDDDARVGPCPRPDATQAGAELLARMPYIRRQLARRNLRHGAPFGAHDLEDLAQEVFVRVWSRRAAFRGDATLEAWIGRFCQLAFVDDLRRRRVRATTSLDDHEPATEDRQGVEEQLDLRLRRLVLPAFEARVLALRLHAAATFADAAARLGCSPSAVKAAYRRAVTRLCYQLARPRPARGAGRRAALELGIGDDGSLELTPASAAPE